MVTWNPHIFIFGWRKDFLMGISYYLITVLIIMITFFVKILSETLVS